MTQQKSRELSNQEQAAYDHKMTAWNSWTDRYSQEQADAWYGAVQNHQQAGDELLRAKLDFPHLFALFSADC